MVLKQCFNVVASLSRLLWVQRFWWKFSFFPAYQPCLFSECASCYPLDRGYDLYCGVQSLCRTCGQSIFCSAAVTDLVGMGSSPDCWTRSPERWVLSGIVALECVPCLKGGDCWSKWGLCGHSKPMCSPCKCLQFCPKAAEGCILSLLYFSQT